MAFKRYLTRGGKQIGPYYYENVRGTDGKVKSIYLGAEQPTTPSRKLLSLFTVIIFLVALLGISLFFSKQDLTSPGFESKTFETDQQMIKVLLKESESITKPIRVMNTGQKEASFKIHTTGLGDLVQVKDTEFSIKPGQTQLVDLNFISAFPDKRIFYNPDVYVGQIIVEANGEKSEIPVIIEIESKRVLFDMNLNIAADRREVPQGQATTAEVTLFNLQLASPSNVRMEYAVKDLQGNIILTETETVVIETRASFYKTFKIPTNMATGTYVFLAKAIYGSSVGTSTYTFDVVNLKKEKENEVSTISICSPEEPLCKISLLVLILLMFFIGAYGYFFVGSYIFKKVNQKPSSLPAAKEICEKPIRWPYYLVLTLAGAIGLAVLYRRGMLNTAKNKLAEIWMLLPPWLSNMLLVLLAVIALSLIAHEFIKHVVGISDWLVRIQSRLREASKKKENERKKKELESKSQKEKEEHAKEKMRKALKTIASSINPMPAIIRPIKYITEKLKPLFKPKPAQKKKLPALPAMPARKEKKKPGLFARLFAKSEHKEITRPALKPVVVKVRKPWFKLPKVKLPKFRLPRIHLPRFRLPRIHLPKFKLPKIHLPKFKKKKPVYVAPPRPMPLPVVVKVRKPWFKLPKVKLPKISLPKFKLPSFKLPKIHLPKFRKEEAHRVPVKELPKLPVTQAKEKKPWFRLPKINMPKVHLPKIKLPKFRLPRVHLPRFRLPKFKLPKFRLPRFSLPKSKKKQVYSVPVRELPKLPVVPIKVRKPLFKLPKIKLPKIRLPRIHLPKFKLPKFRLPKIHLPRFRLPRVHLPKFRLPKFKKKEIYVVPPRPMPLPVVVKVKKPWFRLPKTSLPKFKLPSFKLPSIHLPEFRKKEVYRVPVKEQPAPIIQPKEQPKPIEKPQPIEEKKPWFRLPKISLPKFSMPKISLPKFRLPKFKKKEQTIPPRPAPLAIKEKKPWFRLPKTSLPKFKLPSFKLPSIHLPEFKKKEVYRAPAAQAEEKKPWFRLPKIKLPKFSMPSINMPKWHWSKKKEQIYTAPPRPAPKMPVAPVKEHKPSRISESIRKVLSKIKQYKSVPKEVEKEVTKQIKEKQKEFFPTKPAQKPQLVKQIKQSLTNIGKAFRDSGRSVKDSGKEFKQKIIITFKSKPRTQETAKPIRFIKPGARPGKRIMEQAKSMLNTLSNKLKTAGKIMEKVRMKRREEATTTRQKPAKYIKPVATQPQTQHPRQPLGKTIFSILHNIGLIKTPEERERIREVNMKLKSEKERTEQTESLVHQLLKQAKDQVKQKQFTQAELTYKEVVATFRTLPLERQMKLKQKIIKEYNKIIEVRDKVMKDISNSP